MFSNRERAKRARVSAPQWEWYLTCVQHIMPWRLGKMKAAWRGDVTYRE